MDGGRDAGCAGAAVWALLARGARAAGRGTRRRRPVGLSPFPDGGRRFLPPRFLPAAHRPPAPQPPAPRPSRRRAAPPPPRARGWQSESEREGGAPATRCEVRDRPSGRRPPPRPTGALRPPPPPRLSPPQQSRGRDPLYSSSSSPLRAREGGRRAGEREWPTKVGPRAWRHSTPLPQLCCSAPGLGDCERGGWGIAGRQKQGGNIWNEQTRPAPASLRCPQLPQNAAQLLK